MSGFYAGALIGLIVGALVGVVAMTLVTRRCDCLPPDFRDSELD